MNLIKKRLCLLLAIACSLAAATITADDSTSAPIPSFTAEYKVAYSGMSVARSTISLQREGDILTYQSRSKPIGIAAALFKKHKAIENSVMTEQDNQILPLEYTYKLIGSDKNRNLYYRFDWAQQKATIEKKGQQQTIELPQGTMDNFSLQLALMRDAVNGAQNLSYPVINKGKLVTYNFTNLGSETIDTALGKLETIKIQRVRNNKKKTTYTGWYAKRLHNLPVKIEKQEYGNTVMSMQLTDVKWQQGNTGTPQL